MIARVLGALLLVVAPMPSPEPVHDLLLQYFEGGPITANRAEARQSVLGQLVLAELESLPIDHGRLRDGRPMVRTTLREGMQQRAVRAVGDESWLRPKELRYGVAAVDPATGGVQALWPKEVARPDAVNEAARVRALELASAHATLAAGGVHRRPHLVVEVRDDRGAVLYRADETGRPVLGWNPVRAKEIADHFGSVLRRNPVCGGVACASSVPGEIVSGTPEQAVAVVVAGGAVDAGPQMTIWRKLVARG